MGSALVDLALWHSLPDLRLGGGAPNERCGIGAVGGVLDMAGTFETGR